MSTRSHIEPGASAFHAFTRDMWTEFKIAADYSTGITDVTRGTERPPRGFVRYELGFSEDSPDKCSPGCRCNALRPTKFAGKRVKRPRSGRDWQKLVAHAVEAARDAA